MTSMPAGARRRLVRRVTLDALVLAAEGARGLFLVAAGACLFRAHGVGRVTAVARLGVRRGHGPRAFDGCLAFMTRSATP